MALYGLVDRPVLVHAALFVPLAVVGIVVGQRLFTRHGVRGFRVVVIVTLLVLAGAMLVRSLIP